jgi:FkbM family methyltransferase
MRSFRKYVLNALQHAAESAGYLLIPTWKTKDLPLVTHLRELFARLEVHTVIDVGGNMGQFRDLLRNDVGFTGQIYSFEPVAKYALMISDRSRDDTKWKVFDFALGGANATSTIHVMHSPGLNSFLHPKRDAVPGFWTDSPISGEETVEIRTLDEVVITEGLTFLSGGTYLKLDTQGFDLEVLKGAEFTLKNVCALQTEASIRPIYERMPNYLEAISTIEAYGFDVSSLFPVTYDASLRAIEFDCLFINRTLLYPTNRRPSTEPIS